MSFPVSLFDIPDIKKRKLRCKSAWGIKERLIIIFKGFTKQTVIKQGSNFLSFFSHWLLYKCFFYFLIKALVNFEKLIINKHGENLKILREIFRQKVLVSKVILSFLDHLKSNHGGRHRAPSLFKISRSAPVICYKSQRKTNFTTSVLEKKIVFTGCFLQEILDIFTGRKHRTSAYQF